MSCTDPYSSRSEALPVSPDSIRLANFIVAFVDLALLAWLAGVRWSAITPPRRVMWLGCAGVLASIGYGSLEALYFNGQARVGMLAFGLVMLGIGFAAEIREAYRQGLVHRRKQPNR
jgi:hypothetical protein